jgi:hypothetical protein
VVSVVDDRIPERLLTDTERQRRRALKQVERAGQARLKAEREWRAAIVAAHETGLGSRAIGEAAGRGLEREKPLSHTWINDIVREAKEGR